MAPPVVSIVDYDTAAHAAAFRDVNLGWIREYFVVEPHDEEMLSDPDAHILALGGAILVAVNAGSPSTVLGVISLVPMAVEAGGGFELAKMGVLPSLRGQGVGRTLAVACLAKAAALGASVVHIWSNRRLGAALHLYSSLGFVEVPLEGAQYERADIRLRLDLTPVLPQP